MKTSSRRKYSSLTAIAKPVICYICAASAKNQTELQLHMNRSHPGWLDDAVRKILGTSMPHDHAESKCIEINARH
jgi:hypothetical protein